MGAGCSNPAAIKVQDSVKPKDLNSLTQEAQMHLKMLQAGSEVPGTPSKLKLKLQRENMDINDKDKTHLAVAMTKHKDLWDAVEQNDVDKVKAYLAKEELPEAELYDSTGNSVVHKAASLGHADTLMLLLESTNAKPDMVNSSLATPLHLACKNNRIDAAKFLIGCGVDANQ